ncbi:cilia- and flagella-associated protein 57-like [Schistocerca piceifrons]|uniref:cilia- and flagella-associated protein 57-like n=1 Tax=Schistocerca piceifrons TaxID=274613 RepID=UPI001F5ED4BC|nr:cilia- and flagella-associated protein 57-like [Schistocerca piceifrons]
MPKSNQELSKLKFILHYKTEELRNQIQPKDIQIQNKEEQMMDITEELGNLQKMKISLDLQFVELKEKLTATEREICIARQENNENNALLHQIRNDLHDASRLLHETTQLKNLVMSLYHKYHKDKALFAEHLQVFNAQAQFLQQRDLLERTVTSLKKQVTEEPGKEKAGAVSLMKREKGIPHSSQPGLSWKLNSIPSMNGNAAGNETILHSTLSCLAPRRNLADLTVAHAVSTCPAHEKKSPFKDSLTAMNDVIKYIKDYVEKYVVYSFQYSTSNAFWLEMKFTNVKGETVIEHIFGSQQCKYS